MIEAFAHASANAGDIFKGDCFKRAGHVFRVPNGGAVWFVLFAGDFGQLPVGGDADGTGDMGANMSVNALFDGRGDLVWVSPVLFI